MPDASGLLPEFRRKRSLPGPRIKSGAGPIRGIHVHRNETAEVPPEISKAAVTSLSRPDTTVAGGSAPG